LRTVGQIRFGAGTPTLTGQVPDQLTKIQVPLILSIDPVVDSGTNRAHFNGP
jgi:hypothetical protein